MSTNFETRGKKISLKLFLRQRVLREWFLFPHSPRLQCTATASE
jgi:hypothetical protein